MYEMKSTQQHITSLFRYLLIISGIILCSLLPFEIYSDGTNFTDLARYGNEYLSENEGNVPAEKDLNHSNHIFELVFKETAEKKDSSADTNGLAVIKQGIHHIEVAFVNFSSDRSILYKDLKLLSKDNSPGFVNRTSHLFFSYFLSHTGDIAINAP